MAIAAPPRPFRAAGLTEAARVAALGANVWAIVLLLPALHGGMRHALDVIALPVPLAPLALGAAALARNGRPAMRRSAVWLLLLGFPVSLALALAVRADLADRDAWGALGLFVGALSALAYGAVASEACARPLALRASTARALATPVAATDPPARARLRRVVLGGMTLGGLLIAVVAPALGSRATLVGAWGEAADEATVLASIVGSAAASIAIAGLLGPKLRAPRAGDVERPRAGLRIFAALLVASLALAAYVALRWLEAR